MVSATTEHITVKVICRYQAEYSSPEHNKYFFSYTIRIENKGPQEVQLLYRHWRIMDGMGRLREVDGEGVVGQQPIILPQFAFEYSSYCLQPTPLGRMYGTFDILRLSDQVMLDVKIPEFMLEAATIQN